jgi:SprB repeat
MNNFTKSLILILVLLFTCSRLNSQLAVTFSTIADCNNQCTGQISYQIDPNQIDPNWSLPFEIEYLNLNDGSVDYFDVDSYFGVIENLCAGTYDVKISFSDICSFGTTLDIPVANSPIVKYDIINPYYNFNCLHGAINLEIDGVGPYTVAWYKRGSTGYSQIKYVSGLPGNNGQEDLQNIGPGHYRVLVQGMNCQPVEGDFIVECVCSFEIAGTVKHPSNGQSDGEITLELSDIVDPYTLSWSSGQVDVEKISNLAPGPYCVTVTDIYGCSDEMCFDLEYCPRPNFNVTPVSMSNCADGSISILGANGGNYPYIFHIIGPNGFSTNQTTATHLAPGVYTIRTIESLCGVSETEVVLANGANSNFYIKDKINISQCDQLGIVNETYGSIDVSVPNSSSFTFLWNTGATTEDISGLVDNTYKVTISNSSGCSTTLETTFCCCNFYDDPPGGTSPIDLCYPVEWPTIKIQATLQNASIAQGGFITITPTGGSGDYFYTWSGPNGLVSHLKTISNLLPGIYCVTVHDGCGTKSECFTISQCGSIALSVDVGIVHNCPGPVPFSGPQGKITLSVLGGQQPYTIKWSNGRTTLTNTQLISGYYWVTVTDACGSRMINRYQVITSTAPAIHFDLMYLDCQNSSLLAVASGINAPYSYSWSSDPNAASFIGNPISPINRVEYNIWVWDKDGCLFKDYKHLPNIPGANISVIPSCENATDGRINIEINNPSQGPLFVKINSDVLFNEASSPAYFTLSKANLPPSSYKVKTIVGICEEDKEIAVGTIPANVRLTDYSVFEYTNTENFCQYDLYCGFNLVPGGTFTEDPKFKTNFEVESECSYSTFCRGEYIGKQYMYYSDWVRKAEYDIIKTQAKNSGSLSEAWIDALPNEGGTNCSWYSYCPLTLWPKKHFTFGLQGNGQPYSIGGGCYGIPCGIFGIVDEFCVTGSDIIIPTGGGVTNTDCVPITLSAAQLLIMEDQLVGIYGAEYFSSLLYANVHAIQEPDIYCVFITFCTNNLNDVREIDYSNANCFDFSYVGSPSDNADCGNGFSIEQTLDHVWALGGWQVCCLNYENTTVLTSPNNPSEYDQIFDANDACYYLVPELPVELFGHKPLIKTQNRADYVANKAPVKDAFILFPNPTKSRVYLALRSNYQGCGQVLLTSLISQTILKQELCDLQNGLTYIELDNALPPGIYLVTLVTPDGFKYSRKLIKI